LSKCEGEGLEISEKRFLVIHFMVSLLRDFYDKFRHKKTTIKWFKLSMVEREG
jgi:hypothetical protein